MDPLPRYHARGRRVSTVPVLILAYLLFAAALAAASAPVEPDTDRPINNPRRQHTGRYGPPSSRGLRASSKHGTVESSRRSAGGVDVEDERGRGRGLVDEEWSASGSAVTVEIDQPPIGMYPRASDSTVLFLHVFKCAGTSLRELFTGWAASMGEKGAVVVYCKDSDHARVGKVCLDQHNHLIATEEQLKYVKSLKVMAGHFFWGFQEYTTKPYLMVTTLRNPLELAVSGTQFKHRAETDTVAKAAPFVTGMMERAINKFKDSTRADMGFLRRLVDGWLPTDPGSVKSQKVNVWGNNAVKNLETFWVVGVVEQYEGLLEVLQTLMDPEYRYPAVWAEAHERQENSSPVSSHEVLEVLDPQLVSDFNTTVLGVQWQVYSVAVDLWETRCREVLPVEKHATLCPVAPPRSSYV